MYYVSQNKQDLIDYNDLVVEKEGYDKVYTKSWANIIEHQNGITYAILAHPKYPTELDTIESLEGFFAEEI